MSITTVLASTNKSNSWLFEVDIGNTGVVDYYWSTKAKTWDGHDYVFRVMSFTPISLRLPSPDLNLIPEVKTTIQCSFKDNSIDGYYASDFEGAKVTVRAICADSIEELQIGAWSFVVQTATGENQVLSLQCQDWLTYYLEGDYPTTKLVSSEFPGTGMADDNVCVPIIYGEPYIPLRRIYPKITATYVDADTFTVVGDQTELFSAGQFLYAGCGVDGAKACWVESSAYDAVTTVNLVAATSDEITANLTHVSADMYLLGEAGHTYTIISAQVPKEMGFSSTFLPAEHTFKQATVNGYRTVQIISDAGSNMYWGDGQKVHDVPFRFSRSDTDSITNPADIISTVLQGFGMPAAMIDTASITAAAAIFTTRGIDLNVGLYFTNKRKKLFCKLLAMCGAIPVIGETIGISVFDVTSQGTLDELKVPSGSVSVTKSYQKAWQTGGYAGWQDTDKPQDQYNKAAIALKADYSNLSDTVIEAEWVDGSDVVQKVAKMAFQRAMLQNKTISFKYFSSGLLYKPGDMISIDASDMGAIGNPNVLTDGNLQIWASATDLTSWTEVYGAGCLTTIHQSTDKYISEYAARLEIDSLGTAIGIKQAYAFEEGVEYEITIVAKVDSAGAGKGFYLRTHDDTDDGSLTQVNSKTLATGSYVAYSFTITATASDDCIIPRRYVGGDVSYDLYIGQVIIRKTGINSYDVQIAKMTIGEGFWVDVECAGFSDTLDAWDDISATEIVPATPDMSRGYTSVVQGPGASNQNTIVQNVLIGTAGEVKTADVPSTTGGFIATNTHIRCYNDEGGLRFEADYGGGDSDGDVTMGNYPTSGAKWDQSTGIFSIVGGVTATSGAIAGWTINESKIYKSGIELDSANSRLRVNTGTTYVSISPTGIIGHDDVLGDMFILPTNGSSPTFSGTITSGAGAIAGWTIDSSEIKKITANAGLSMNSAAPGISVTDANGYVRAFMGKNGAVYGIEIKNASNQSIVKIDDTDQKIAGWTINNEKIYKSGIELDSTNSRLRVNTGTAYVSISPSGIVGHNDALGDMFILPTNGSSPTFSGTITSGAGAIAGWTIDADEIKKITANAGVSINSATPGISVTDANGYVRVFMGKTGSDYGIEIKNASNQSIVKIDDTDQKISGWTAEQTALAVSTNIRLDSTNKKLTINDATFGNAGIQLDYNAGNPQFYCGDGSDNYLKYTSAGGVVVSTDQAGGVQILGGGDITLTGSDGDPGKINFDGTSYGVQMGGNADGSAFSVIPSDDDHITLEIGESAWWGDPHRFRYINISANDQVYLQSGAASTDWAEIIVDGYGTYDHTGAVLISVGDIATVGQAQYVAEYDHFGPRLISGKKLGCATYPWDGLFLGTGALEKRGYKNDSFADDETYALPEGITGIVHVLAVTAADNPYGGIFLTTGTGKVVLLYGYGNPSIIDADGYLCCYDGGAGAIVKNRLGVAVKIRVSWCQ